MTPQQNKRLEAAAKAIKFVLENHHLYNFMEYNYSLKMLIVSNEMSELLAGKAIAAADAVAAQNQANPSDKPVCCSVGDVELYEIANAIADVYADKTCRQLPHDLRVAMARAAAKAHRARSSQGDASLVPNNVIAFLLGEAALDGVWFGNEEKVGGGRFWWRKYLRVAPSPPKEAAQVMTKSDLENAIQDTLIIQDDDAFLQPDRLSQAIDKYTASLRAKWEGER